MSEKTLRDMTYEELQHIACLECGAFNIGDEACISNMKCNEPVCVDCCIAEGGCGTC